MIGIRYIFNHFDSLRGNIFLNESIISWLNLQKKNPVRTCRGPFGSCYGVDERVVYPFNQTFHIRSVQECKWHCSPLCLPQRAFSSHFSCSFCLQNSCCCPEATSPQRWAPGSISEQMKADTLNLISANLFLS